MSNELLSLAKENLKRAYSSARCSRIVSSVQDSSDDKVLIDEVMLLSSKRSALVELRSKKFCLIKYANNEECIKSLIEILNPVHYAYILHDKDVLKDGSKKENHWHILLTFENQKKAGSILKIADGFGENTLLEVCRNLEDSYRYLTHSGEKAKADGKFQYSAESVVCDESSFWDSIPSDGKCDSVLCAFEERLKGEKVSALCRKYGRDYILNRNRIEDTIAHVRVEEDCQLTYTGLLNEFQKQSDELTRIKVEFALLQQYLHDHSDTVRDYLVDVKLDVFDRMINGVSRETEGE